MNDAVVQTLMVIGAAFVLLAGLGVIRMPDLYMRMSTVTKGATMGLGLLLTAVVFEFQDTFTTVKALAVIIFGFITGPVAAHMISRAAYFQGVSLWEGTVVDELKGQYEARSHELASPEATAHAGSAEDEPPSDAPTA